MNVDAVLPIRTQSENNMREHYMSRSRRRKAQRQQTRLALHNVVRPTEGELEVQLVRIAPRQLDDDNLAGSMKAIRDEIADMLGRDDAPTAGIKWSYEQRRGEPKQYAVTISIRPRDDGPAVA